MIADCRSRPPPLLPTLGPPKAETVGVGSRALVLDLVSEGN
ncbi:hypothetical protein [Nonomuraea sp. LPB2021202275-12-8]